MTLTTPRLDDRTFADIAEEARRRIPLYCPEWTDHNLSDPGITLIELFAWMTDIVLYRLNRVPDRHYVKFMELIGMRLREAEPARVSVTFWLSAPQPTPITIPAGTEVATTRTETEPAIIFSTDQDLEIRVPTLNRVLVSQREEGGKRSYKAQNITRLAVGFEGFAVFSDPPQPGDALYLGVDEDLSHHMLGIEMDVETAGGAGIDPANPPYVWEALNTEEPGRWAAAKIDHDSTLGMNAAGLVRLHLPRMTRGTINRKSGYWVRCKLDPPPGVRSYRVSPQIRRLVAGSWGGTVNATHATTVRNEVLGHSDGSPGQRLYLEHTPVLPRQEGETLLVRLEDGREETWQEVRDFADSTPKDLHYTLDSDTGEVRLGPALRQRDGSVHCYGALPARGATLMMRTYRHGGGQAGNVQTGALNVLKSGLPYVERVRNREDAQGGLDAENLEDARLRVPGYLRSLGRAVTAGDYEYLAREAAPGLVGRVFCLQPPLTNLGEIKVLVIPRLARAEGHIPPEALTLPNELRDRITASLDERRLLSTRLDVLAPAYQWVSTRVRLRVSAHADAEAVRAAVEARLFAFLNPLTGGPDGEGWPFGRDLFVSDVIACLLAVPGVDFIRSVELYPVSYDRGEFTRGEAAQEIPIVSHGVVASHEHDVRVE
jgi:predicted phage baseplate assembly protein